VKLLVRRTLGRTVPQTSAPDRLWDYAAKRGSSQQHCDWWEKSEPLVSDAGLVSKSAIGKNSGSAALLDLKTLWARNV